MRALRLAAFVAAALVPAAAASAQVTTFICTPDAQVLKQVVNADGSSGGTSVWYTGGKTDTFYGCKVGPDGWLYMTSGASIQRLNLITPTASGGATILSLLPSAGRAIAFNVTTLYVNTASNGIYTLKGVYTGTDPLSFPDPATQLFAVSPANGHGIAFDVPGNLVLSSGSQVQRAAVNLVSPFYTNAPAALSSRTATVFDTAVNPCGEIVYADKQTRTVRKRAKTGAESTVASFANSADYPSSIEIDSNSNIYVTTMQSDTGAVSKVWRIAGNLTNNCAAAAATLVVDLSTLLTGPGQLKGLKSASALGIAVTPTDASLTMSFSPTQCSNLYDFGYHTTRLTFDDCSVPFTVTVDALKSKPSEVTFGGEIPTNAQHVPSSSLGGFLTQYRFNDRIGASGPLTSPFGFNAQFSYYAQVVLGTPGLGRAASHSSNAPYLENVATDFWDLNVHDGALGDRGPVFSKRVIFNVPLPTTSLDCTIKLADWGQPFNSQNPLYKVNQSVVIQFTATTPTGAPCGGGGTMRVSVARIIPTPITLLLAVSTGNAQTVNIMTNQGDKYSFNLDTTGYGIGTFLVTVSGDKIAPTTRMFSMGQ